MKTKLNSLVVMFALAWAVPACNSGTPMCVPHDNTICRESSTYWVDSCGIEGNKDVDCDCGCNDDFSGCKMPCDCTPECSGKECGPNSCGGNCAPGCGAIETCNDSTGQCVGLTWQNSHSANSLTMYWQDAINYCNNLTLDGHSDWRLPTISELRSLIRGCPATEIGGSCGVTDSCLSFESCWSRVCAGCSFGGGPTLGCYWPDGMWGLCQYYWSSSEREDLTASAWRVNFRNGFVDSNFMGAVYCVRCVR